MALFITLTGLALVLSVVIVLMMSAYNSLSKFRTIYRNALTQIEVQLYRRCHLTCALAEAIKAHLPDQSETLDKIIHVHQTALGGYSGVAHDPEQLLASQYLKKIEIVLTQALEQLLTLVAAHETLSANRSITSLMEDLDASQKRMIFAQQYFNATAILYNSKREVLHSILVAKLFKFDSVPLVETKASSSNIEPNISLGTIPMNVLMTR